MVFCLKNDDFSTCSPGHRQFFDSQLWNVAEKGVNANNSLPRRGYAMGGGDHLLYISCALVSNLFSLMEVVIAECCGKIETINLFLSGKYDFFVKLDRFLFFSKWIVRHVMFCSQRGPWKFTWKIKNGNVWVTQTTLTSLLRNTLALHVVLNDKKGCQTVTSLITPWFILPCVLMKEIGIDSRTIAISFNDFERLTKIVKKTNCNNQEDDLQEYWLLAFPASNQEKNVRKY